MSQSLMLENVVKAIESAFKPLECAVEVFDYNKKLRFRVFNPEDRPLLRVQEALVRRMCDPDGLKTMITECRARLERKGYKLKPWKAPAK